VRPRTITLAELKGMKQVKRTSVMQCAGNGRSYYAAEAKAPGGQWQHGGLANVEWEGVPLKAVLAKVDVGPSRDARYLMANGADQSPAPKGADLIKSYHLEDTALDNAIVALKLNGEPIPAIHGGPVRLIIPGYYGNMNVKFLDTLSFETEVSPTPFMLKAYRFPDSPVKPGEFRISDYNTGNSRPTYAFKIMSVVFAPLAEDTVKAELDKGEHVLRVVATDALGRTQPMNGLARWNPKGYEWNGVDTVKVTACPERAVKLTEIGECRRPRVGGIARQYR